MYDIIQNRPIIVVLTKADLPGAHKALIAISSKLPGEKIVPVSSTTGQGLIELSQALWEMTGLMRVYTNKDRQDRPFIVLCGYTVLKLAFHIHKEIGEKLDKAFVWGSSAKYPGQMVGKNHVL